MKTNTKINESTAQTHSRNNGTHRTHSTHLVTFPKAAFTLAEVLITLAIIGVVAAITIPSLVRNYNEKAWGTAQSVFEKRLEVATRQMNTEEKLAGYSNTMDFVNELKKYIKITRVCDNNNITKCFNKEVIWNEGEDPIDMSQIKTAESFGLDWKTRDDNPPETVAVQFANGVNAIIAYNPNTTQEPFNNQFSATSNSMAILYDVSGNKNPNTNGKDIAHNANVTQLAGVTGCLLPEEELGFCISQILAPDTGYSALNKEECEQIADAGYGNKKEWCGYFSSDYWAGAVKACGGINNMPTMAQLGELATYVYNHDSTIGAQEDISSGLTLDTTKASQFLSASPYSDKFYVWSGQEYSSKGAYLRHFLSAYTFWDYIGFGRNYSDSLAVCLDH